jgi:anhydro-N-acetylmuramic acid kinase
MEKRQPVLDKFIRVAVQKSRVVVGLMSGTSHDGVDAVVAKIAGLGAKARVKLLGHSRMPYPKRLRERVAEAFNGTTESVCRLNFELGEFFAKAALKAISEAGLGPDQVDLIGSHGQTVHHIPPAGGRPGSTLQIGEGAVIARRTGALTVTDFRPADIAAGGHGAPLVPYADWVLFRETGKVVTLQNIGGISNVTVVTDRLDGVTGFDTGPGCSLLDETVKILSSGKKSYDSGGRMATSGRLIPDLLQKMLVNPYFKQRPPKSTGRELFGRGLAEDVIRRNGGVNGADILCTLTHLTARSIYDAYIRFVLPVHGVERVILAGGGARNGFLVELLRELFGEVPVVLIDGFGIPAEAREALCFAVLANETVSGNPSNVPSATGAAYPAILGKISF